MSKLRNVRHRLIKLFLLMALPLILITTCHHPVIQQPDTLIHNLEGSAECQVVQHALGETCIPLHPHRIVVLDQYYILDSISALGMKPVGFTPCLICTPPDTLSKFVAGIASVGDMGNPSLEKILSLKPDLILGLTWQKSFYSLLSNIAPTVMIEDPEISGFKETLKYLARILNRSDQVEEILAEYNGKIQSFRRQFGEKLKAKTVAVIYLPSSSAFVVHKPEFTIYGQVMIDAGIQLVPAYKNLKSDGYNTISIENLTDWDADFLFVLANYKRDSENLKSLSFLKQPIWSTLKAVQNKRVHPMILDVSGPITANQFVDDLHAYFANIP
ncbi:MAG: ABC transporter substrate-binding protein [Leptolyngbyaceae cyanobacterium SL_5_14]|nr:ABC transporter substrate-binding protein [Leptolyngbyaceae cyanobacterium SL_5_14]